MIIDDILKNSALYKTIRLDKKQNWQLECFRLGIIKFTKPLPTENNLQPLPKPDNIDDDVINSSEFVISCPLMRELVLMSISAQENL